MLPLPSLPLLSLTSGVAADLYSQGLSLPWDLEAGLNLMSLLLAALTVLTILWGMMLRM